MNTSYKLITTFNFGFGIYGATRSIRADKENIANHNFNNNIIPNNLTILGNAFVNTFMYSYPIINFIPLYKLYNRIQIQQNNLDKNNSELSMYYKEFSGHCFDTI